MVEYVLFVVWATITSTRCRRRTMAGNPTLSQQPTQQEYDYLVVVGIGRSSYRPTEFGGLRHGESTLGNDSSIRRGRPTRTSPWRSYRWVGDLGESKHCVTTTMTDNPGELSRGDDFNGTCWQRSTCGESEVSNFCIVTKRLHSSHTPWKCLPHGSFLSFFLLYSLVVR
jgi:hypothetical protein